MHDLYLSLFLWKALPYWKHHAVCRITTNLWHQLKNLERRSITHPFLILCFLGYSFIQAFGQSPRYSYCDSILSQASLSASHFDQLDSVLFLINYYQSDTAVVLYQRAIDKALASGLEKYAGIFELRLSDLYHELSDDETAKRRVDQAVLLFRKNDEELWYARTANIRRVIAITSDDFLESYQVSYEALEIFERYGDERGMAIANRDIGSIKIQEGHYDDAKTYCLKSVKGLLDNSDWYELGFSYQRLAILNRFLGDYEQAHQYVDKAIAASRKLIDFRANQALAKKLWTKGYVYEGSGDFDNALMYYDSAKYYADIINYHFIDKFIATYKGGIFLKKNDFTSALDEFTKVLDLMEEESVSVDENDLYLPVYTNLVLAHEGLGQHQKANALLKDIIDNKDSIYVLETSRQISELQTKYETSKKDQAIISQQKELAQKNRIQLLGGGLLVLLATLLGSLFFNYKNNQKITAALAVKNTENEFLVKEIHHRVKNNLQILSSLLSLQSNSITNTEAAHAIAESRNRVESMGMIHQQLYSGEDKTAIEMSAYIDDVCAHLEESFLLKDKKIKISSTCDIGKADVETVIPLGLIINELITNSIKYAFDKGEEGEIKVQLSENASDQLCLVVADNGRGMATDGDYKQRSTNFGSDLVTVLIKKLKGSLTQSTEDGFVTTILFDRYKLVEAQ